MHPLEESDVDLPMFNGPTAFGTWHYVDGIITLDPACSSLLRLSREESVEAFASRFGSYGAKILAHEIKAVAACKQTSLEKVFKIEGPIARPRWIKVIATTSTGTNGRERFSGACVDVTTEYESMETLGRNHEFYRATLSAIADCVISFSSTGEIQYVNAPTEKFLQFARTELEGSTIADLFDSCDDYPGRTGKNFVFDLYASLRRRVSGMLDDDAEMVLIDGRVVPISGSISVLQGRGGNAEGVVLIFRDATTDRNIKRQLFLQATTDSLTLLKNRREFERNLSAEIDSPQKSAAALAFIDLDHFKVINDSRGHAYGDRLLQEIARKLTGWCESADVVSRIAGDEFAVLFRQKNATALKQSVSTFIESVTSHNRNLRSTDVGLSVGLVYLDEVEPSVEAAMMAADIACYQAKNAGRGHVVIWEEGTSGQTSILGEDLKWASRLSKGLEDGVTEVYFQKIEPMFGDASIAELLVRFRGDDGRLHYPGDFMHAAERYGVSWKLDIWMLKKALHILASQRHGNPCERLAVNVSPASILNGDFRRIVLDELNSHVGRGRIPNQLILEITETFAARDIEIISNFARSVQFLGVEVAIDDYGSGATSLKYLEMVKASILKIDGNVIKSALLNVPRKNYLRGLVGLARAMQMKTVAEFVDSPEALDMVKELSIDYAQGFHLHEPVPLEM